MSPEQFIATWKNNSLSERAGAQQHFSDLCDLLGVDKPRDPQHYCFERGARKAGGGDGWADVWKRGHFGWENKKPGRDLDAALKQLTDYALQLDNPPLLVVCDRERIRIHTAFTGYPDQPREIRIDELIDPEQRQLLRWVFTDPAKLRPEKSTAAITAEAAGQFAGIAKAMRSRGLDGQRVAHFLVQCLFCMFAEDEELLPKGIFTGLLAHAGSDPAKAGRRIEKLFIAMQKRGGEYGDHDIPWFNGGLFKAIDVPPLAPDELRLLHHAAAEMDWRAIDPTIFGTLFERGLDPVARAPLGAHYTDTGTIEKLIRPLISEPLQADWDLVRVELAALAPKFGQVAARGKGKTRPNEALQRGLELFQGFLARLNAFRVLDPACGSGNFLYLALKALRDIEKRVHVDAIELGLPAELAMQTGPHNILGLEINEFAAELARVTVWIGDIQWCRRNGYPHAIDPILKPLDGIEHRDALLDADGTEAAWPAADVIVGNPPFLGDKVMRSELGADYVETLRKTYEGRVPGGADLVTYWFEKARAQIEAGQLQGAGLVSTNSIRGGANRKVLERIVASTRIFEAWGDEPWVNEGAAVRVSLLGFGPLHGPERKARLDGVEVDAIHADLTADIDVTKSAKMRDNLNCSFQGVTPSASLQKKRRNELGLPDASFNLEGKKAREILQDPATMNGEPMAVVVRPYLIADDITSRPLDRFIINFVGRDEMAAAMFQKPFEAISNVRLNRLHTDRFSNFNKYPWWQFGWPRPEMFTALKKLPRYISIPRVSKHYLCVWTPSTVTPGDALVVVARDDDTTLGILQSRIHEVWALRRGTSLGVGNDPRYTHTTCFETFPFPAGLTPNIPAGQYQDHDHAKAIATAALNLIKLRDHYLNPPDWTDWEITPEEQAAGFPKRPVAKPGKAVDLKKRTLTNLYNERPSWLALAHQALDKAVAAAYGWTDYQPELSDDEILRRLLALNLERAGADK